MEPPTKKLKKATQEPVCCYEDLPEEVWLQILSHLNAVSLVSISRTCSKFHQMTQEPTLWQVRKLGKVYPKQIINLPFPNQDVTLDWQSIKLKTSSVNGLLSRATRLKSLTIDNRRNEQV